MNMQETVQHLKLNVERLNQIIADTQNLRSLIIGHNADTQAAPAKPIAPAGNLLATLDQLNDDLVRLSNRLSDENELLARSFNVDPYEHDLKPGRLYSDTEELYLARLPRYDPKAPLEPNWDMAGGRDLSRDEVRADPNPTQPARNDAAWQDTDEAVDRFARELNADIAADRLGG